MTWDAEMRVDPGPGRMRAMTSSLNTDLGQVRTRRGRPAGGYGNAPGPDGAAV
jgi:hypothetical protein